MWQCALEKQKQELKSSWTEAPHRNVVPMSTRNTLGLGVAKQTAFHKSCASSRVNVVFLRKPPVFKWGKKNIFFFACFFRERKLNNIRQRQWLNLCNEFVLVIFLLIQLLGKTYWWSYLYALSNSCCKLNSWWETKLHFFFLLLYLIFTLDLELQGIWKLNKLQNVSKWIWLRW